MGVKKLPLKPKPLPRTARGNKPDRRTRVNLSISRLQNQGAGVNAPASLPLAGIKVVGMYHPITP